MNYYLPFDFFFQAFKKRKLFLAQGLHKSRWWAGSSCGKADSPHSGEADIKRNKHEVTKLNVTKKKSNNTMLSESRVKDVWF